MFKRTIVLLLAFVLLGSLSFAQPKPVLKTAVDSISYALGMNYGLSVVRNLSQDSIAFNTDLIVQGIKDVFTKAPTLMTEEVLQKTLTTLQQDMMAKRDKKQKEAGELNKRKGETFLTENKKKEGVKTTESGLQYKLISEGKGRKPTTANEVKVHYKGTLIDGKVFDSSIERGQPITFPVTGVIKGWTEGLQLMTEGSKYMFYIPSELAYGDRGAGGAIGPNETLIFEVELLEVIDKSQPKTEVQEAKPVATPDKKKK